MNVVRLTTNPKVLMTTKEYNNYVDLYSDNLYRFILNNLKDIHSAEDIVQETYLKFWEKKDNVDTAKVKSYLFTTAYRTMIDLIRKSQKSFLPGEIESNESTYNHYNGLQEVLHNAIEKLPPVQKSVVLLRDYEGYSYSEIAEITELTESQVKVYIFRARKFLKTYIGSVEAVL